MYDELLHSFSFLCFVLAPSSFSEATKILTITGWIQRIHAFAPSTIYKFDNLSGPSAVFWSRPIRIWTGPTSELRPGSIRHGDDHGLRIIIPVTNVNIVCQRKIRRPIKKIKKNRKVPRTVKNNEKRNFIYIFFSHYVLSFRACFFRAGMTHNFLLRDKEGPARPNADNRFESVSATRDASLWHYKVVHQNGSAVAQRPHRLSSHGQRCGFFVMSHVEFQHRKATHKRLLAHTRASPPLDFFVFY